MRFDYTWIRQNNFDKLQHFSKPLVEFYQQIYEEVQGFDSLRRILQKLCKNKLD